MDITQVDIPVFVTKSSSVTHRASQYAQNSAFTDVFLLSVWVFTPKWMPLYRKTTQLGVFMWERYWWGKRPLWRHRGLPRPQLFMEAGSQLFIFSIWLSESQPGMETSGLTFSLPTGYICSLVQFSFPFRDILFEVSALLDYKMPQGLKWCLLGWTVCGRWLPRCLIVRYQPRDCHQAQSCGQRGVTLLTAWRSQSEDHGRISQIKERYRYVLIASICEGLHTIVVIYLFSPSI